jgi:GH35 family endo-1,4-beta-xylanase
MLDASVTPQFVGKGKMTVLPVAGMPFTSFYRLEVPNTVTRNYDSQLVYPLTGAVTKGDAVAVSFYWRRVNMPGEDVIATVAPMQKTSPYALVNQKKVFKGDGEWQRYDVPLNSISNVADGTIVLKFQVGWKAQTLDIAGVTVHNYAKTIPATSLPFTANWGGRGLDAAWRAQANTRIDQYRKGNLTVNVVDRTGRPVPGAQVRVKQTRNDFEFGTAVASQFITEDKPESPEYRQQLLRLFNTGTPENHLKWVQWEANPDYGAATVAWLRANGFRVRGHSLIWPKLGYVSWRGGYSMPEGCELLTAPQLRDRIDGRFLDALTRLSGQVDDWDVINEPFLNYDVQGRVPGVSGVAYTPGILGNYEMVRWFQMAKLLDPNARLTLNENNMVEQEAGVRSAIEYSDALVRYLKLNGAPLDILGFQSHFRPDNATSMDVAWRQFDRYAALGVKLKVTEYDFDSKDEVAQADYLRDYLTLCYSHPAFEGFTLWGFWERGMWHKDAALFRADWTPKLAAGVWERLVLNEWRTEANATADPAGSMAVRAFCGRHQIEAQFGLFQATQTASVTTDGATVTVTLPMVLEGRGLVGTYFSDVSGAKLTNAVLTRLDPGLNFNWGTGSPDPLLPADLFSVRWTGWIRATKTGNFRFRITSDDGVRLRIGDSLLIDDFTKRGRKTLYGNLDLVEGQFYPITIEYFEGWSSASIVFAWMPPGESEVVVPATALFDVGPG